MRGIFLSSLLFVACLTAFGQGKVSLCNDGGCLYMFNSQPIPTTGPLPSGVILEVGLYGGTSSTSMTLQGHTLLNPPGGTGAPAGLVPLTHVVCNFPGGVLSYFQVFVWDASYADPQAAIAASSPEGHNNIFTMIPGTGISYPLITTGGSTTWSAEGNETPLDILGEYPVPIESLTLSGGSFVFTWMAAPYQLYLVEYKTDLAQTNWGVWGPVQATNYAMLSFSDSVGASLPHKFYRVMHLPF